MRRARIYEHTTLVRESLSVITAKRKRFIPSPLPLAQKDKATAFSFCNQGESLALPLLALARRLDTTASLLPALEHHEAGENRCELFARDFYRLPRGSRRSQ